MTPGMTPGIKSTEFLAFVVVGLAMLADGTAYINVSNDVLMSYMAIGGAYIGQRGWVKSSAAKAKREGSPCAPAS